MLIGLHIWGVYILEGLIYVKCIKGIILYSDEALFYPFIVSVNKCGGSCNAAVNPFAQFFVLNKAKKYECKSISYTVMVKCGLNESVCY